MRTGLELPATIVPELEQLEQRMRHVGSDLTHALSQLPTVYDVVPVDEKLVDDIRWNIAEAVRLARKYRSRLCDRLAGSTTPAQGSSPQSLHDPPPDACQHPPAPPP